MDQLTQNNEGLLFYLSGETETADFARGQAAASLFQGARPMEGGICGKYLQCDDTHRIAFRAPGNMYAERGTVSFFWRSRIPLGFAPFPVFRASFADNTSWDQTFLRIDYNGQLQGFDAFVTDINSARIRVSTTMHPALKEMEWVHIAFAWDETVGVKLYLNGILSDYRLDQRVLYAALDSFAPHQRITANWNIQSAFYFIRGGDLDELRIYDRMLTDDQIMQLSRLEVPVLEPLPVRSLNLALYRKEWDQRHGWDHPQAQPQYYNGSVSARKVMPVEAFERGQWNYKSIDGIRETTWPYMFNRSRLPGRNDYFQLPDWNCYYDSGKEITYTMPDEPYNHIEMEGGAFGSLAYASDDGETPLFERARFQQYTVNDLSQPFFGKKLHYKNVVLEEPISSFEAFYVTEGTAPVNSRRTEVFYATANGNEISALSEDEQALLQFIDRRFTSDERQVLFGTKDPSAVKPVSPVSALPVVQLILPYDNTAADGLDGIAFDFPALPLENTIDGYYNLQIAVKDPLWKYRDLAVFTLRLKAGEAKTLWLDLRDRILPAEKAMMIVFSASAADFSAAALQDLKVTLHYKDQKDAWAEHYADSVNRIRDVHGNLVEERASHPRLLMYEHLIRDLMDILRYAPEDPFGQMYLYEITKNLISSARGSDNPDSVEFREKGSVRGVKVIKTPYEAPKPAADVEPWAHYQILMMKRLKYLIDWWTEHRMIENGELGGGLSDDGDQMEQWLMLSSLGINPDFYRDKHRLQMEAYYDQGMFIDGHTMIVTDGLHTYEDGVQMLTHEMLYEPYNPKVFERALENLRADWRICEYAPNGDLQIISRYFSGNHIYRNDPWNGMDPTSLLILGPSLNLASYCGLKPAVKLHLELAEMLLHHFHDGAMHSVIDFKTGKDSKTMHSEWANQLRVAHFLTRDDRFLVPIRESENRFFSLGDDSYGDKVWEHPQCETFDKEAIAAENQAIEEALYRREYINTEGYTWSDRQVRNVLETQWQRLGGVVEERNYQFVMSSVYWRFAEADGAERLGIMMPYSDLNKLRVLAFNISDEPVHGQLVGKMVDPGIWKVRIGLDPNGDQQIETVLTETSQLFENYLPVDIEFAPKTTTIIEMELVEAGQPYHERPDLGIGPDDVVPGEDAVTVTIHSMGSVDAPESLAALFDPAGNIISTAVIPAMAAPNDMYPHSTTIVLPGKAEKGWRVVIDPDQKLHEITRINNELVL